VGFVWDRPSCEFAQVIRGAKLATRQRWQGVVGERWTSKPRHSTLLMALSKIEGLA